MFDNHYDCPRCCTTWTDTWSSQCDDDCPQCGLRHISPSFSDDVRDNDVDFEGGDVGLAAEPPALPHAAN